MTKQMKLAGLGLSVLSVIFYFVFSADYAVPNAWTAALGSIVGMDPFRPLSRPLWQAIMYVFSLLPTGQVFAAATLLNVLLGGVAVWLTFLTGFRLLVQPVYARTDDEKRRVRTARLVAGLISAGFVAVSMPMLVVATRAHPLMLDICLLMAAVLLMLKYRDTREMKNWYLFAAVYGVGVSEFATFILLAPLFLILWVILFWRSKKAAVKPIAAGLVLIALGTLIGVAFCWLYANSVTAEWREFSSFYLVYKTFVMDQVNQIQNSVPKQGWLVVFLTMILPAVFVVRTDYYAEHDFFTRISFYIFHLILVGVACVLLFNLPGSPWSLIGSHVLLVTPYFFASLWFGQLIAYFYHTAEKPIVDRLRPNARRSPFWKYAVAGLSAAAIIAAGFVNMSEAMPAHGKPLAKLGKDILEGAEGKQYLLGNGIIDTLMQWEAYTSGSEIRIINPAQVSSLAYRKFLNTWFNDPELESISKIGFVPLINLWMSKEENISDMIAVQGSPELWRTQGFYWIPHLGVYKGEVIGEGNEASSRAANEENLQFLERHLADFADDRPWPKLFEGYKDAISRNLSVFANNVGFQLLILDRTQEAKTALSYALRYQKNNLSALVNLGAIAEAEGDQERLQSLEDQYNAAMRLMPSRLPAMELTRRYGYVRNRMVFMQEGLALVDAGLSERGMGLLEASMTMGDEFSGAEIAVAEAFFNEGRFDESMEAYRRLVEKDAGNVDAWIGVARCHIMQGRDEDADAVFLRLEDMGVRPERLAMERGYLSLRQGNYKEALAYFEDGVSDDESKGPAAVGMIWAGLALGDQQGLVRAESILKELPQYYAGQMMLYELAMARQNLDLARRYIMTVINIQPGNAVAVEKLIRLELLEGQQSAAKKWLQHLLAIDSMNAYGNYLLSGMHESDGRLDLAENALRRALLSGPRGDVFYGLAWIKEQQGAYEEAMDYIDQALELSPENPQYIAVKGIILGSLEKWATSEERLREAISIRGNEIVPLFQIHLAHALVNQRKFTETREVLEELAQSNPRLSESEADLLDKVQAVVDSAPGSDPL